MILTYSSKKLQSILTDKRLLKKYYSNDFTKIDLRISELIAANNLSEIPTTPPPRRHKLVNDYKDCWAVDYSKNDRIVFEPIGQYDINELSTINEIRILNLGDYH